MRRLTPKQETFCLKYLETGNATQAAIQAGYSKDTARAIACENLSKPAVAERIAELQKRAEDEAIASVVERKEILSEIARGKLSQFTDDMGIIDRGKLDSSAIQAVDEQTIMGKRATVTKLRLHNPIQAISELNKMEKVYEVAPLGQDNRVVNIYVMDKDTKELIGRVKERTGKLIENDTYENYKGFQGDASGVGS